jgi:hypothetical protein
MKTMDVSIMRVRGIKTIKEHSDKNINTTYKCFDEAYLEDQ